MASTLRLPPDDTERTPTLRELIRGIDFAMLTTLDRDGRLHSRPMAVLETERDGELWFFVSAGSVRAGDIREHEAVNLTYTSPDRRLYVSVCGTAEIVVDRALARRLWKPVCQPWFPLGAEDPDLALLRVDVSKAEYWEAPNARVVQLLAFEDPGDAANDSRPEPCVAAVDEARRAWEREKSGRLLLSLEHLFSLHSGRPH